MNHFFSFLIVGMSVVSLGACNNNESKCCDKPATTKIVVTAAVEVKPDQVEVFKQNLGPLMAGSRAEAGCISYTPYQSLVDNNKFFFFEEWKDQAAIDAHFATSHFKSFGAMMDTLALKPIEVKQLEVIAEK